MRSLFTDHESVSRQAWDEAAAIMSHQSPMISIPKKTTDEVDWTTPIRHLIAKSYGENPDSYIQECQALQRCRQDAVKGAGSDTTGESSAQSFGSSR